MDANFFSGLFQYLLRQTRVNFILQNNTYFLISTSFVKRNALWSSIPLMNAHLPPPICSTHSPVLPIVAIGRSIHRSKSSEHKTEKVRIVWHISVIFTVSLKHKNLAHYIHIDLLCEHRFVVPYIDLKSATKSNIDL